MTEVARAAPDPVAGGTPAQERKLSARGRQTLASLLEAGLEVLAEKGYRQTRVDDICRQAGVSHGTFYLNFANKDRDEMVDTLARIIHAGVFGGRPPRMAPAT